MAGEIGESLHLDPSKVRTEDRLFGGPNTKSLAADMFQLLLDRLSLFSSSLDSLDIELSITWDFPHLVQDRSESKS